jgi:WD40 repeat protein/Ca2+-binding EF-hand superfamily protein
MGQEVSQIAFNEDLADMKVAGLSRVQVEMLSRTFECLASKSKSGKAKFGAKNLANLTRLPLAEAAKIVEFADLDGDGCLSCYEFICLVGLVTQKDPEQRVVALFSLFDEDNSHFIDESELQRLVKCVLAVQGGGQEPAPAQLSQKMADVKLHLFSDDPCMKLAEFKRFCFEDDDFRSALLKLGVFQDSEVELFFNHDIAEELHRHLESEELNEDPAESQPPEAVSDFGRASEDGPNEFLAVRPYLGAVKNSVPSSFDSRKADSSAPDSTLQLEFVHGFRCFDTRNNVFWAKENKVVFHTAAVGVVLDPATNQQRFNFSNTDDIISIAKHGPLVATGQIGHKPVISLWDCETLENFEVIIGDLQKGISHLAFSSSGKTLAGVGLNDDHDIAVYDVSDPRVPRLKFRSKGPKDAVLSLAFSGGQSEKELVLGTQKEIYVHDLRGASSKLAKVSGWGSREKQPCLVIGALTESEFAAGFLKGEIALVRGKSISNFVKGHAGAVFAMAQDASKERLFTGGADGVVCSWTRDLKKTTVVNLRQQGLGLDNPKIRTLAVNESCGRMLIGTRGGEILELDPQEPSQAKVILRGHFDGELWGLAAHPTRDEFVTVGEDFLLAKWSLARRTQLSKKSLKFQAKTLDVNQAGNSLVVGCTNGVVFGFDYSDLKQTGEARPTRKEVSVIKFAPGGQTVAVGAHDSHIYLLDSGLKTQKVLRGHHSTITHLDFSQNGGVLQSTCTSYELLYWDVRDGKQLTSGASANKDEHWASWSCTLGWPVQGIYPPCADGTDVNMVARNSAKTLLATSDDFGLVKLFRYPCLKGALDAKYVGHSSHVTNITFCGGDRFVVSTGGNDKAVFQWKLAEPSDPEAAEFDCSEEFDTNELCPRTPDPPREESVSRAGQSSLFKEMDDDDGNEFMAIKPWKGDLAASTPSNFVPKKGQEDPPEGALTIAYVHGYRCFDARETAKLGSDGLHVVFATASLGVLLDVRTNAQSFFQKHDNDVVALGLHPQREVAATGQMAQIGRARSIDIFVWDVQTKAVLANFNSFHQRAIQCLKFSPSGKWLLSFGRDDDNSLAIFDWKKQLLVATAKVDKTNVLDSEFVSETNFYSAGSKHLKFWTFNGKTVVGANVSWKSLGNKAEAVVSLAADNRQTVLATTQTGKALVVRNGAIQSAKSGIHAGLILVVQFCEESQTFLTGGKDGVVNELRVEGGNLTVVRTVVKLTSGDSVNPGIKVLDTHSGNLLVGTAGNDLFFLKSWRTSADHQRVLSGHSGDELWGLACCPLAGTYATCGDDMAIKTWDISANKMVAFRNVNLKMRAIDYSKCGKWLVAGSMCGKLVLVDSQLREPLQATQTPFAGANQWIEELKFSPDGRFLAFGAHGGVSPLAVYSFDGRSLAPFASIRIGFTSALLHLDWSEDSSIVMANSQAYELKFADVRSKQQVSAKAVRDVEWATWTCKIGWPVQGIFPGVMGTEVNAVCRAENKEVLATGENSQLVKLFRYPCAVEKAKFKSYLAHASFVTRVRFTPKDSHLISVGGHDNTSIVWKTDFGGHPSPDQISTGHGETAVPEVDEDEFGVHRKTVRDKYHREPEFAAEEPEATNDGPFRVVEAEDDTEFMAVKPWLGAIRPPSNPADLATNDSAPRVEATLEYVHGFRAKDCRNNVTWSGGKLFYNAAGLAVSLDPSTNTQRFFQEHTDDVISIAFCPATGHFATGEVGPKPRLFVWDPKDMKPIFRLEGGVIKGVGALAFSPKGDFLAATCIDDDHMVAVYDLKTGALVACEKGDTANILAVEFTSDSEFATVGMRHFKQWKAGGPLKGTRGNFGKGSDKLVVCRRLKSGLLCGSATGELQLWQGGSCGKLARVHRGPLDCILVTPGNHLVTGGRDCKVNVLDVNLTLVYCLDLNELLHDSLSNQVRALAINDAETELFVGTFSSEIHRLKCDKNLVISRPTPSQLAASRLLSGHFARNAKWTNEVWGLSALSQNRYLTVSDDGTLRMWSVIDRCQIKCLQLDVDVKGVPLERHRETGDLVDSAKLRTIGVSQNEKVAGVGTMDGTVRIVSLEEWRQVRVLKTRKRWISDIKFSPNDELMAVGSHDAVIDIYRVADKFRLVHSLRKHSAFITHLDWSADSNYLHSNCGAYELLFWDANNGRQLTGGASALRDEHWATWSCVLGWPVQGVFKKEWDGSDVNAVDRSHAKTRDGLRVLAAANDFGTIHLLNYPCLRNSANQKELRGHSSHVTNVRFSPEDTHLFSTGGEDQTVMQWRLRFD